MGLDLGLERPDRFRPLGWVECSPAACDTIRANMAAGRIGHLGTRLYAQDIRELEPASVLVDLGLQVGDLDLLAGGSPCQSFSTIGHRRGLNDERGALLWEFLRFVYGLRPKCFLLENVPGLLSARLPSCPGDQSKWSKGRDRIGPVLRAFLEDLPCDYRAEVLLVNALNYGVPQNRSRVLVLGNRFNQLAWFPGPTHGGPGSGLFPYPGPAPLWESVAR